MAERKFSKDCHEWLMFQDFYRFVQAYYLPENAEDYWNRCVDAISEFHKKHKSVPLSKHLAFGFLNYAEEVLKNQNEKEWICPSCGKIRNPNDRFCRNCGRAVERSKKQ